MGGPQSRYGGIGEEKNILILPRFESRIVQPVASHCTERAVPVLTLGKTNFKIGLGKAAENRKG